MCEHCDRLDELVDEVNRGERTFDQELLAATLTQNKHVLDEVIADCFSAKPLHEILDQAAITMSWMGHALSVNARTVARASRAELDRLAKIGQQSEEANRAGREKTLVEHMRASHHLETSHLKDREMRNAHHTEHFGAKAMTHPFHDYHLEATAAQEDHPGGGH